ncbi:hypothetical protein V1508DRAFT_436465 [Lipomyces doorenjongii]|uniref:uncharacterized protein n=1 Tax=Lipomyces doorenjongii TaxID=383834 RepID=UPI0034CE4D20
MGFLIPGLSISRVRRKQRSLHGAFWNTVHESKRRKPDHYRDHYRDAPTLDRLPTEVIQLIFIYSHNFEFPLVCRRFSCILRHSRYLQIAVLAELFQYAPSAIGSIYDRRFITKELIVQAVEEGHVADPIIEPLSERLTLPPYTDEKVALLEYLVVRGGAPINPSKGAFLLAENFYANPMENSNERGIVYREMERQAAEVYYHAFGPQKCTARQQLMVLLMKYVTGLEIDAEVTDILFCADQYQLVEFGIACQAIDPVDPELWEKATCRGDAKAMEFLYKMDHQH